MIADAITLIDFLRKHYDEYRIISALFDSNAQRIEGEQRISCKKIPVADSTDKWFYTVDPLEGYVFIYMPVIPTVYVDYGKIGDQNPDSRIFRFVGNIFSAVMTGGNPNVRTDFIVVGYKPIDLLSRQENS